MSNYPDKYSKLLSLSLSLSLTGAAIDYSGRSGVNACVSYLHFQIKDTFLGLEVGEKIGGEQKN